MSRIDKNQLMYFKSYYKYEFIFANEDDTVECDNSSDLCEGGDIYRTDLTSPMKLKDLLDYGFEAYKVEKSDGQQS